MITQTYMQFLRPAFLCAFLFLNWFNSFSQKSISFYAGAGVNGILNAKVAITELRNIAKAIPSPVVDLGTKIKFSKHFSLSLQYMRIRNHLRVRYKDLDITYWNHYSQTGSVIGNVTFVDDIFLHGNVAGMNFNYEIPFEKNNVAFGTGLNGSFYNTNSNYIKRHYESLPPGSFLSKLETSQRSFTSGTNFVSINISALYERMLYKNQLSLFMKVNFFYNFNRNFYEYEYFDMGLEEGYTYSYDNRSTSTLRYYTIWFHTLNFTAGVFYNINFKSKEKPH